MGNSKLVISQIKAISRDRVTALRPLSLGLVTSISLVFYIYMDGWRGVYVGRDYIQTAIYKSICGTVSISTEMMNFVTDF